MMFRIETYSPTLPYSHVIVSAKKELAPGSKTTLAAPEFTWATGKFHHLRVGFSKWIPIAIHNYIFHPVSEDAFTDPTPKQNLAAAEITARAWSRDDEEIRIYEIETSKLVETFNRDTDIGDGLQVAVRIYEIKPGKLVGTY